jgi:UDP-N-acetylmuramoyl-tripeptide--D-alanyl-D-alanine ligase
MRAMTLNKINNIVNGTLITTKTHTKISSVSIDSRNIEKGALFVALEGVNNDGHNFVEQAFLNGAAAALIKKEKRSFVDKKSEYNLIAVEEPLKALQLLAKAYVESLSDITKIGITGSTGKTTTKEMIASILSTMGKTVKTPGNYNSEIGLPLSLMNLDEKTEYGVFEMGVDRVGEMKNMVDMWKADIGLITNIGNSHIGKMGSLFEIAKEKSNLFHNEIEKAFIGENSRYIPFIEKQRDIKLTKFGYFSTNNISSIKNNGLKGWSFKYKNLPINLNAVGNHNLINAFGSIAIASYLGAEAEQIKLGLENYKVMAGRSNVVSNDVTVIEDWYNSSLDSTNTIVDYVGSLTWKGDKIAILGSMKELGNYCSDAHKKVAHILLKGNLDKIYLYGEEIKKTYDELFSVGYGKNLFYTNSFDSLADKVAQTTKRGDLVLLKGSRSMAMEQLVPILEAI